MKGIDPLVESVIAQCLAKDPKRRPISALHVAMALPGGNPMQIALEAGATPSPEMVAASPKKGALKPAVALSCLIGGVAMLAFCMFASMRIAPQNRLPFTKSSEVLSERANEIAAKFGYTDEPAERWYRFYIEDSYVNFVRENPVPDSLEKISSGQPLVYVFVERQSPRNFDMWMAGNGFWLFEPQTASGMRTISLDTRGRLVEFSAVPPQFADNPNPQTNVDFSPAFQSAELDPTKFKETTPIWTPANAFDTRKAWEGALPDLPETPLRVEAASFQGKIVSFQLIYPWTKPNVSQFDYITTRDWIGIFIFAGILIGTLITAIFLARKNVKSGSGDRTGAFKTALIVLVLIFFGWFLAMNHIPSFFPELARFSHSMRMALYVASATWLFYLALEPIVRRNLPELIVSWNRLLVGDWRDPLVGRDCLIGTLFGIAHLTLISAAFLTERLFYGDFHSHIASNALIALRSPFAMILSGMGMGIVYGFMQICLLVILFLMLRRRLYAGITIFVLIATIETLFFAQSLAFVPFTVAVSGLLCLVISRFGLVATIVGQTVFGWAMATLFTLNFSAWYATPMIITVALILLLLAYGFKISLANQQIFVTGLRDS